jgi:metallothionein
MMSSSGTAPENQEEWFMAEVTQGTVLSCAHEGCGCQIVVQKVCHCEGTTPDSTYTCACGAPMVVVETAG